MCKTFLFSPKVGDGVLSFLLLLGGFFYKFIFCFFKYLRRTLVPGKSPGARKAQTRQAKPIVTELARYQENAPSSPQPEAGCPPLGPLAPGEAGEQPGAPVLSPEPSELQLSALPRP